MGSASLMPYRFDWLMPELVVCLTAFLVLLVGAFSKATGKQDHAGTLTFLGLAVAAGWSWYLRHVVGTAFFGAFRIDGFSTFVKIVVVSGAAIVTLLSMEYWRAREVARHEFYALLLFATAGMMLLPSAADMISLLMAIEIMSLSVYVLTAIRRDRPTAIEASLKYFVLGAFATGILVYGIALVYGATGSLSLIDIAVARKAGLAEPRLFTLGMGMILVGLAFKVASVPFHMWAPDVYQGAPAPVTGFMAVGVKAAAFAATLRVFGTAFGGDIAIWQPVMWWLAVATILVGNFMAITQDNIKRMLAYSSIAHAGYLLIGVTQGYRVSGSAILFYLGAYVFMNLGAFGVLTAISGGDEEKESISQWAGLAKQRPVLAALMALFMFSMAGIPPTAGFFAKFTLFYSAVQAGDVILVLIAVFGSLVSLYYYLRVIVVMYMHEAVEEAAPRELTPAAQLAMLLSTLGVLILGVWPSGVLNWAKQSIGSLF